MILVAEFPSEMESFCRLGLRPQAALVIGSAVQGDASSTQSRSQHLMWDPVGFRLNGLGGDVGTLQGSLTWVVDVGCEEQPVLRRLPLFGGGGFKETKNKGQSSRWECSMGYGGRDELKAGYLFRLVSRETKRKLFFDGGGGHFGGSDLPLFPICSFARL